MAPSDLLLPLDGQRDETLRLLDRLDEADLDVVEDGTGWSVRHLFAQLAGAELAQAFLIRRAADGEVVHLRPGEHDPFTETAEAPTDCDRALLRAELAKARARLREIFESLVEADLDRGIRWPEWPARTIRTSIPYMLEHEDSHVDRIRRTLRI